MPRTKEFEAEEAIEGAMEAFWEKGFKGTSLSTLTNATGLHKGSLYGAFQSKEELYVLCLDAYMKRLRTSFFDGSESARDYLKRFFKGMVHSQTADKGCLIMNTCLEFSEESGPLPSKAKKYLNEIQQHFVTILEHGIKEGEFSSSLNVKQCSERLLALGFTLKEMGKFVKNKTFLQNIANGVLSELDIRI